MATSGMVLLMMPLLVAGTAPIAGASEDAAATGKPPVLRVTGPETFDQHARSIELDVRVRRVSPGTKIRIQRVVPGGGWGTHAVVPHDGARRFTMMVPVDERTDAEYRICSVSKSGVAGCSTSWYARAVIVDDHAGDEPRRPLTEEERVQWIQAALDEVNARRAEAGVAPLTLDETNAQDATDKARYLYETGEFPPSGAGFTCSGMFLDNYEPRIVNNPSADVDPAYTRIAIGVHWTEAVREDDVYFAVVSIMS